MFLTKDISNLVPICEPRLSVQYKFLHIKCNVCLQPGHLVVNCEVRRKHAANLGLRVERAIPLGVAMLKIDQSSDSSISKYSVLSKTVS